MQAGCTPAHARGRESRTRRTVGATAGEAAEHLQRRCLPRLNSQGRPASQPHSWIVWLPLQAPSRGNGQPRSSRAAPNARATVCVLPSRAFPPLTHRVPAPPPPPQSRGNQRDIDRARAQKRKEKAGMCDKKDDGLTPLQRKERDAKALQARTGRGGGQRALVCGTPSRGCPLRLWTQQPPENHCLAAPACLPNHRPSPATFCAAGEAGQEGRREGRRQVRQQPQRRPPAANTRAAAAEERPAARQHALRELPAGCGPCRSPHALHHSTGSLMKT